MTIQRNNTPLWLWFIPVLLIAAWLGVRGLNADMIWYDEYWSIWSAGGAHYGPLPLAEILDRSINEPSQPPTYYLMLSAWGALAGWTPLAARYLSFLMGVLALAWTYRLGTDAVNARVGVLGALLLGTSAIYVTYLHELRLYSMMVLFATMTLALYWRVAHSRKPGTLTQMLFALSVILAFYSHYFTLLAVSAVGLYHLVFVAKDRHWWRVIGLMVVGGVAYVPWFGYTLGAVDRFVAAGGRTDTASPLSEILTLFTYALSNGTFVLALLVPAAFGWWWLQRNTGQSQHGVLMLAFVALLIFAQGLLLNALTNVLTHVRYILALWPLLMLLAALGVLWVAAQGRAGRVIAAGVVVVWMGAGVYNSVTPEFSDRLFRDVHTEFFRPNLPLNVMGEIIHNQSTADDAVALHSPYSAWAIGGGFDLALHGVPARYTIIDEVPEGSEAQAYMANFIGDAGRVWLAVETNPLAEASADATARQQAQAPLAQFEGLLDERGFSYCDTYLTRDTLSMDLYARDPLFCGADSGATVARFGGGVALNGVALTTEGDGNVQVMSTWHTDSSVPAATYSVGMYVFNAAGEFVAQGTDYELPTGNFRYHTSLLALDVPPGDYTLTLAVYNWQTGERLPVLDSSGTDALIGQFTLP